MVGLLEEVERNVYQTLMVVGVLLFLAIVVGVLFVVFPKLLGAIFVFVGIVMLVYFPELESYQPKEFTMGIIFIAIGLILIGLVLFVFG